MILSVGGCDGSVQRASGLFIFDSDDGLEGDDLLLGVDEPGGRLDLCALGDLNPAYSQKDNGTSLPFVHED